MSLPTVEFATFPTELGWFALLFRGSHVLHLTIGHAAAATAHESLLENSLPSATAVAGESLPLVARLQAYAAGAADDFSDVAVELTRLSPFQRRVVARCREIPYGQTLTYGQLAALAGSPRAARAVGNTMARNHVPLIIPCHRVVHAGGGLGGFSAPQGTRLKRRLLEQESAADSLAGVL